MLQALHNKNIQNSISFNFNEDMEDVVARIYQKIIGLNYKVDSGEIGRNTALNFPMDEYLDTIDRFRSPLAMKRLEDVEFTESEFNDLQLLDSLTGRILSLLTPIPEESIEEKLALEYAKRVSRS